MADTAVETLRLGAMLHDVGKIGVADTVLNKPERLGELDWRQIKQHPVIGYEVLEPVGFLTDDHLSLVRSHHERLDGSGYPDGLTGHELSDLVRVIAVADTYDAMSGDRAYRKGLAPRRIVEELRKASGRQIDRKVANLFIDMIETGEITRYATQEPRACA
jgi:HD-GYP domain-containing protein (c-di-GMP phosphodiesterase class II)